MPVAHEAAEEDVPALLPQPQVGRTLTLICLPTAAECAFPCRGGRPVSFRYYSLLAPLLGDAPDYADEDASPGDTALQPSVEKAPDMCRLMDAPLALPRQTRTRRHRNVLFLSPVEHLLGGRSLQADLSRKTPWSEQETRTLLEIWGEDPVQLTLKGSQKNRHVFDYISEQMNSRGYLRTTDQCYSRIKRLKYSFLHEK